MHYEHYYGDQNKEDEAIIAFEMRNECNVLIGRSYSRRRDSIIKMCLQRKNVQRRTLHSNDLA